MGEVTDERFCPICEQIVPREVGGVPIKISPARKILIHEGCGIKVHEAVISHRLINSELVSKEEDKNGD